MTLSGVNVESRGVKMAGHSAIAVANYFLDLSHRDNVRDMDALKVMKLVYFAHGWHLAMLDEPLLVERIQAWPYGPIVEDLYHEVKRFGRNPIKGKLSDPSHSSSEMNLARTEPDTLGVLNRVWETYGKRFNGVQLSNMTHLPGTPWREMADAVGGSPRDQVIDDDDIKRWFKDQAERNKARRDKA